MLSRGPFIALMVTAVAAAGIAIMRHDETRHDERGAVEHKAPEVAPEAAPEAASAPQTTQHPEPAAQPAAPRVPQQPAPPPVAALPAPPPPPVAQQPAAPPSPPVAAQRPPADVHRSGRAGEAGGAGVVPRREHAAGSGRLYGGADLRPTGHRQRSHYSLGRGKVASRGVLVPGALGSLSQRRRDAEGRQEN